MNIKAYNNGRDALKSKDYKGAARDFEEALKSIKEHDDQYNNVLASVGLSQVLTANRNGLLLCRDAASSEVLDGDVFLYLACAEWHSENRKRAIDALDHGCKIDNEHEQLKRAIALLDVRKRSVFKGLSRTHMLNRTLGKLLRRGSGEITVHSLLY
jgi:hypothetical protein